MRLSLFNPSVQFPDGRYITIDRVQDRTLRIDNDGGFPLDGLITGLSYVTISQRPPDGILITNVNHTSKESLSIHSLYARERYPIMIDIRFRGKQQSDLEYFPLINATKDLLLAQDRIESLLQVSSHTGYEPSAVTRFWCATEAGLAKKYNIRENFIREND